MIEAPIASAREQLSAPAGAAVGASAPRRLIFVSGLRIYPGRVEWHGAPVPLTLAEFLIVDALAQQPGIPVVNLDLYATYRQQPYIAANRGFADESVNLAVRTMIKKIRFIFREIDPGFDEIKTVPPRAHAWADHAVGMRESEGIAA